jgi:Fic family protein
MTTTTIQQADASTDALREVTRRIRAEYADMPGLCLTVSQAQRLWAIDQQTCERALRTLVAGGILRRTVRDRFVLA